VSRFLFAWELGSGLGHLGHVTAAAQALRAVGHSSALAVRDLRGLASVDPGPEIPVWQAPVCIHRYEGLAEPPLNYAEVLMRFGFLDQEMMLGLARAWRELVQAARADIIVADHAPTAILSARSLGLPCAVLGNGFTVPPLLAPTPNMRPWQNVSPSRLADSENKVLDAINFVLARFGVPVLAHLRDLFAIDDIIITNFPELDHYAALRTPADLERITFCGPIGASIGNTVRPVWPVTRNGAGDKRIFAYLKPDYPHIAVTLNALAASGQPCVIYGLGAGSAAAPPSATNLAFSLQPIDVTRAGNECAIGICHAGTLSAILLQLGRPLLLLPMHLEQFLAGLRVLNLGAGLVINPEDKQPDISGAMARLLNESQFADRAAEFAARYRDWSPARIVGNAVARLESVANGKGDSVHFDRGALRDDPDNPLL
jgi:UDP:flavonoid glycosyltransferase YjiC (YdhE family)